jgi:CheY-like chemotaxis protein
LDNLLATTNVDIPVKPRVLIADDSRIVRATLIKHIEGLFEFREALDGEEAWETLLIDPNIRVVITDLTMPKLDGYGLLQRIRKSKISRIRNMPVVVVSGSDEQEERERAKALGATDLITKGIGTAQLLSRLDILAKLVNSQQEFERGLESLVQSGKSTVELASVEMLENQADGMLQNAFRNVKNFVILNVCVGLKHVGLEGAVSVAPASVVSAVGQLLQGTVRQTDIVAKSGEAEFTLVTGSIQFDSARNFAQRICGAIGSVNMVRSDTMLFVASCGMVSLSEYGPEASAANLNLSMLRDIAHQRAALGLHHAATGVVGPEEAAAFRQKMSPVTAELMQQVEEPESTPVSAGMTTASPMASKTDDRPDKRADTETPDLATLLQWIKEGKQDQVLKHMGRLSAELQPLIDFMLQQTKR